MNASTEYWQKVQTLFNNLRKHDGSKTSDILTWVTQGLVVGAAKEMRQSNLIAHQVTYTILVDVILDIQDDESRDEAWKTDFQPKFRQYYTTKTPSQVEAGGALINALLRIAQRRTNDFEKILSDECKYLIGSISRQTTESEMDFKILSQRWVVLTMTLLRRVVGENAEELSSSARSAVLKISIQPFEEASRIILESNGTWVDGMDFLASLTDEQLFRECLCSAEEMQSSQQALKVFVSPENTVKLLHSPSSRPFIRVVVAFCALYGGEMPEIWDTVINEAVPTNRPIDMRNPDSLLYQVVTTVKSSSRTFLHAPSGVNANLVRELTTALKSCEDLESGEARRLQNLLISVVALRGNVILIVVLRSRHSRVGRNVSCVTPYLEFRITEPYSYCRRDLCTRLGVRGVASSVEKSVGERQRRIARLGCSCFSVDIIQVSIAYLIKLTTVHTWPKNI